MNHNCWLSLFRKENRGAPISIFTVVAVITIILIFPRAGSFAFAESSPIVMHLVSNQTAYVAPNIKAEVCAELSANLQIKITFMADDWYGFTSPETKGKICWVNTKYVEQVVKTRSAALAVPLLIDAGMAVVRFFTDLFTDKLFKDSEKNIKLKSGDFVTVLEETKNKVKVRMKQGLEGWVPLTSLTKIKEISATPDMDQGIWVGHDLVVSNGEMRLDAWVQKVDGTRIPSSSLLTLGDEYEIHAICSKDCYLRITCETPAAEAVCQYSPNQIHGFKTSPKIPAGQDAWPFLLPQGIRFQVGEPVMGEDVLRVEAISAEHGKPFHFVSGSDKGEGCVVSGPGKAESATGLKDCSTRGGGFSRVGCGFRGGGFSITAQGHTNPVPEVVNQITIRTQR